MENKQVIDPIFKDIDAPVVVNFSNFKLKQAISSSVDWIATPQNGSNELPHRPHGDDYLPKEIENTAL